MDNTTVEATTIQQDESLPEAALIACQIVNIILLGVAAYLSACVVGYGWKNKSWKQHHPSRIDRGTIYTICLVAMLADVPRLVLGEIVFNVSSIPEGMEHCEELMDTTIAAYFAAIFPKYIFLWYRQHTINSHPASIRLISTKCMQIASYSVLLLMTIILILLALFYSTYSFTKSAQGCIFIAFEEVPPVTIMNSGIARDYIIASGFILIEVMLLILFVLPLLRNYQLKRKILDKTSQKKQKNSLTNLMKRSAIAAAIVVIIDIAVMVVAIDTPPDRPVVVLMVTYNIRNAIHAMCVLSSFASFRQILTVFIPHGSIQTSKSKENQRALSRSRLTSAIKLTR